MRESARGETVRRPFFTGDQLCFWSRSAAASIERYLNAPFASELIAAPGGGKVAWILNERGARNVWVAAAPDYKGRRLTSYKDDDGQDLGDLAWSADGRFLVYARGGDLETSGDIPNPRNLPATPEQAVYAIPFDGGAPKKLGDGRGPAVSRDGHVAFVKNGQLWMTTLDAEKTGAKPVEAVHTKASSYELQWSPDGSAIAFNSYRGDHSFIGVYRVATKTLHLPGPERRSRFFSRLESRQPARRLRARGILFRDLGRSGARCGDSLVDPRSGCGDRRGPRGLACRKRSRQRVSRDRSREPNFLGRWQSPGISLGARWLAPSVFGFRRRRTRAGSHAGRFRNRARLAIARSPRAAVFLQPGRYRSAPCVARGCIGRQAFADSGPTGGGMGEGIEWEPADVAPIWRCASRSCVRAPPKSAARP